MVLKTLQPYYIPSMILYSNGPNENIFTPPWTFKGQPNCTNIIQNVQFIGIRTNEIQNKIININVY